MNITLETIEMIWDYEGIVVEDVSREIRVVSQAFFDIFEVEVLHYILSCSVRVKEVPVPKVWCGEIRR